MQQSAELESIGNGETPRLYWTGNVAKARVIAELLKDPRPSLVIFDYGAGRGGDWPHVLAERPGIDLVCYEPSPADHAHLKKALAGTRARILDDAEFTSTRLEADYVVSFSVLEHVRDRAAYLAHGKRHLAPKGRFFLNYDDGHFRTSLDLDEFRGWMAAAAVTAQNRLAWLWPRVGRIGMYQARATKAAINGLLIVAGLSAIEDRYENLSDFKRIAATLPPAKRQEFCHFWMATEDELNRRYKENGDLRMGDDTNLWRVMGSRTLTLVHA